MNEFFAALPALLEHLPDSSEVRRAVVFAAWKKAAGGQMRDHAVPVELSGETLRVAVADQIWQRQMASLSGEFIYKINSSLRRRVVSYIEFVVDPSHPERVPAARPGCGSGTSRLSEEVIREAGAIGDEHLRETFLKAAESIMARNEKYGR